MHQLAAHLTTEIRDGLRCLVRRWVCTAERVPQADPADAVATTKCRVDGKGQRQAIPPMILSHPNDHDNRSFSSSSARAASARAPAWERLAGPESTPESR